MTTMGTTSKAEKAAKKIEAETISLKEAAARLGFTDRHIRKKIAAGEIPVITIGSTRRISRAWLDAKIAEGSVVPDAKKYEAKNSDVEAHQKDVE